MKYEKKINSQYNINEQFIPITYQLNKNNINVKNYLQNQTLILLYKSIMI